MSRISCLLGVVALTAWMTPGCSGKEFTSGDGSAGEAGDGGTGGATGGTSGAGASSSGKGSGGSDAGGTGTGGVVRGGTSSGGSATGGDAGEGATGGSATGGAAGSATGGAGAGNGGVAGAAGRTGGSGGRAGAAGSGGAGAGGRGGAGSGGKGGAGSGGKGGTGGGGSAGKGGMSGSGGTIPVGCPPTAPAENSACSGVDYCTYGSHPLQDCRDTYGCFSGHWEQTSKPMCDAPQSCSSQATPPVNGAECTVEGRGCLSTQNVYCLCAANCTNVCSLPPIWHCFGPPAGCPATLPNLGQPCSGTMTCTYGTCASQTAFNTTCSSGRWTWSQAICPG